MFGRTLCVLMWKHLMVRKRRFIHTAVELTSPLLFFLLVFSCRSFLKPIPSRYIHDESLVKMTEAYNLPEAPNLILYTPDTYLTRILMEEVGIKLGKQNISMPDISGFKNNGYHAFSSMSEIAEYVKVEHTVATVIFEDMDGNGWGDRQKDKLTYTIRMLKSYETYSYQAMDGIPGPHEQFGTYYGEFMMLQWAIDISYIKLLIGNDYGTLNLTLQEFPYYGGAHSQAVIVVFGLLPTLSFLSLFISFVFLMSRLLEERTTGIQELIQMVGVSTNMLGISHFLNVLPTGLMFAVVGTVLMKASTNPLIDYSDGIIIFIGLLLYFVSVVAMAYASSYLVKNTQYTVSVSVLAIALLATPWILLSSYPPGSRTLCWLSGALPHVPMVWMWQEMMAFEQYKTGLTFADIFTSHSPTSGPVFLGFAWMIAQIMFFFALSWYLSHVRPGPHSIAQPWNFIFQKSYWTSNEVQPESVSEEEEPIARDERYFEATPKDMEIGIKIDNVSKCFPKHKALSNVSLEVYKGEITVLLGHNGAGKTTLMSIITGMMSATEGKVFVNNMDTVKQRALVRSEVGLCPQHNLFFPDLTVLEHAMFYTLLKRSSYSEAHTTSMALLKRLGIQDKANNKSGELSGGMKRRLQLACALAGGANVLVLDEPTSGLDVETRRELWDLLLSLRGSRTVLLTTHFMEEADALGDRVAALHLGRLRCHATPMHLKKAIGTGYRLSFTTNGVPRDGPITSVVTSFVPDASLKEKTINSLSYNLPATGSAHFPNLFTSLEEKRSELGIETIGVGISTLEEVFLKLCSDTDVTFVEDEVDTGRVEPTYNKVTGCRLYLRQFWVLFKRQYKYILSKRISFLIMQVIMPICAILLATVLTNEDHAQNYAQPKIDLDLDLYKPLPERRVLIDVEDSVADSLRTLENKHSKVVFTATKNITDAVLSSGMKSPLEYNKHLVAIELHDNSAKIMFTTVYRHTAPVALNLLTNLLLQQYSAGQTITTYNHPIDSRVNVDDNPIKQPKGESTVNTWAVIVVFVILTSHLNLTSLPCKERISGSRHLHVMAGCPAALLWLGTLTFHAVVCVLPLTVVVAVAAATVEVNHTIDQPDMILTLCLVLIVGCLAFCPFMYIVSFNFAERTTSIVLTALIMLFGLITPIVELVTMMFPVVNIYVRIVLSFARYFMPPHALMIAATKCVDIAHLNALCTLNKDRCPNFTPNDHNFDTGKCCAGEKQKSYFALDEFSPAPEIMYLVAQFVVYMSVVVMTQLGMFNCLRDRVLNARMMRRAGAPLTDEIVRAEAVLVNKEIALPRKQIESSKTAMLVSDVHKNYFRLFGKSTYAVKGLSFAVKKGECFGLLGVNGAGKSTTFKMLTAEECTTKGDVYANGHFIKQDRGQYLRSLGYCPQFFGLDGFQTGRDNLELLLTLRGLDAEDVTSEVKSWIEVVGLEKYSNRNVSGYSGGCTRRLGAAAALSSGAPLTLLDEPTAGVDVAARRRVWAALRRALARQRAVLITSHSMDEMEALCSRIGIMSGGVLRALGTPAELRARHAQGHAVLIRVKHAAATAAEDEVDGGKSQVESLKSSLHSKFNCTLKDSHKTMLHYHINETMRYSDLFSALETLKNDFPHLVEDYSVTETTLEEVFLSIAKENQIPQQLRNGVV